MGRSGQAAVRARYGPAATAQYQLATTAVEFARQNFERAQYLANNQVAPRTQLENAQKVLDDAKAQLRRLEAQGANKAREIIRAPATSIVTRVLVAVGDRIPAETTVVTLADRRSLIVLLGVELSDAVQVSHGAKVMLQPVWGGAHKIDAEVSEIHCMVNPQTGLVDAVVKVATVTADGFALGTTMRGILQLRDIEALFVPRKALLRDNKSAHIFVVEHSRAFRRDVDVR